MAVAKIPNPPPPADVPARLRRAWRKEQRFVNTRGLATLALWLAALAVVNFVVDWLFLLPGYARLALWGVNVSVIGWVLYDRWLRHRRPFNPVRVALQVERRHPDLNSLLVSYVQIGEQPRAGQETSPGLIRAMRREALRATAPLDFREIINFRELRRILAFSTMVLLACGAASLNWTEYVETFLHRMVRPSTATPYPTRTKITRITGHQTVRQGDPLTLEAVCANRIPLSGRLLVRSGDGAWETVVLPSTGPATFAYHVAEVFQGFAYRVRLGDAVSEVYRVDVVPPPRLVQSRVHITHPAHTGLADREVESLNLEVPEGSTLRWQLQCDRPLAAARLVREGGEAALLDLDASGRAGTLSLLATQAFVYRFQWTEREHGYHYEGRVNYFVNTIPDAAPEVELLQPEGDEKATVRKKVPLYFRANDDYRVAEAWIVYSLNRAPEARHALGAFTNATVEAAAMWDLRQSMPALKEGDVITYALAVADNRAGRDGPNVTRSRLLQLAIVSTDEYLRYVLEQQARLVKEIEALRKEEQSASREVKTLLQTPLEPGPGPSEKGGPP
jgi:hypothetical protein